MACGIRPASSSYVLCGGGREVGAAGDGRSHSTDSEQARRKGLRNQSECRGLADSLQVASEGRRAGGRKGVLKE